ncbi:hypothetical protein [Xanthomonas theicola]|nr:hypothetical protein [Xanthomonas theicola]
MPPVEPAAGRDHCAAKPRNEALRLDALRSYAAGHATRALASGP